MGEADRTKPITAQKLGDDFDRADITYQWFLKNCRQVMEMIQRREDGLYSRYIGGATQFFGMGLGASTHPQLVDGKGWEKEVSGSVNLWPTVRYMEKSVATVDPVISRWECNTEILAESGVTAANCFVYKIE